MLNCQRKISCLNRKTGQQADKPKRAGLKQEIGGFASRNCRFLCHQNWSFEHVWSSQQPSSPQPTARGLVQQNGNVYVPFHKYGIILPIDQCFSRWWNCTTNQETLWKMSLGSSQSPQSADVRCRPSFNPGSGHVKTVACWHLDIQRCPWEGPWDGWILGDDKMMVITGWGPCKR